MLLRPVLCDGRLIYKGIFVLRRLEDQRIEKDEVQNFRRNIVSPTSVCLREQRSACGSAGGTAADHIWRHPIPRFWLLGKGDVKAIHSTVGNCCKHLRHPLSTKTQHGILQSSGFPRIIPATNADHNPPNSFSRQTSSGTKAISTYLPFEKLCIRGSIIRSRSARLPGRKRTEDLRYDKGRVTSYEIRGRFESTAALSPLLEDL